jgi:hypothetical protein
VLEPLPSSPSRLNRRTSGLALVTVLLLVACGDAEAPDQAGAGQAAGGAYDQPTAEPNPGPPSADVATGTGSSDSYELSIGGGSFAGTHQGNGDLGCFAQNGMWGATVSHQRERGVSDMLVMLTGVPATGGSTEAVNIGVTFGQMDDDSGNFGMVGIGEMYGGAGRATVEREGRGATIRINGAIHDGTSLAAVIRCGAVEVVG